MIKLFEILFNIFEQLGDSYRKACVLARRGSAYRLKGTNDNDRNAYDESIQNYIDSIKLFNGIDEDFLEGVVQRELGTTYLILGYWRDAINSYRRALQIFESIEFKNNTEAISKRGQTIYGVGLAYLMQGKWDEAILEFKTSLEVFRERKDAFNTCLALTSLGIALRMTDNYPEATPYLEDALKISVILGDRKREGFIRGKLGSLYRQSHDYDKAIMFYLEALDIAKNKTDRIREGRILGSLGTVYRRRNQITDGKNDFEIAEQFYNEALKIFTEIGDRTNSSWILEELGQIYIMQGSTGKAIETYNQTLETIRNKKVRGIDENLVDTAQSHIMIAISKGTIYRYEIARTEIEKIGDLALQAKTLRNLGEAYRLNGQFPEAKINLSESLNISLSLGDRDQQGKTLCYLGRVYVNQGEYNHAIRAYKKSIEVFKNIGDRFLEGWAWENLGTLYLTQRNWGKSITSFKEAINLNTSSWSVHLSLAICYRNYNQIKDFQAECNLAYSLLKIRSISEYDRACFEAVCGDPEKAYSILEILNERGKVSNTLLMQDPHLQFIRGNERFNKLLPKDSQLRQFIMPPFM